MGDAVASRLRAGNLTGRTVTIKDRFGDFRTITRSSTIAVATNSAREIARVGRMLLAGVDPTPGVRLLGLAVSQLTDSVVRNPDAVTLLTKLRDKGALGSALESSIYMIVFSRFLQLPRERLRYWWRSR